MRIYHLSKLCRSLHTCTGTAPETMMLGSIYPVMCRTHRSIVSTHSFMRIIISEDMIIQYPFVIIHHLHSSVILIQGFRQPHHIHGITRLRSSVTWHSLFKLIYREEVLSRTVSTNHPGMLVYHSFPEKLCRPGILIFLGIVVYLLETRELGNLRIGMPTVQYIPFLDCGNKHVFIIQKFSPFQILLIACNLVYSDIRLIDRTMFTYQ